MIVSEFVPRLWSILRRQACEILLLNTSSKYHILSLCLIIFGQSDYLTGVAGSKWVRFYLRFGDIAVISIHAFRVRHSKVSTIKLALARRANATNIAKRCWGVRNPPKS